MDRTTLKTALADLERQRVEIEEAILHTRKALSVGDRNGDPGTLVDDAVECLNRFGEPQHIDKLTELIGEYRGSAVTRANLEASLSQHLKTASPKVVRVRPGFYGFPKPDDDYQGITDDDVPF